MTALRATTRDLDQDRHVRLQLAWLAGDKAAFDYVLADVIADPIGVPGVLFALTEFTAGLGMQAYGDTYVANLQAHLARQQLDPDDGDEPGTE